MKLFFTPSVQHLVPLIGGQCGRYMVQQFADGEWFVRVDEDVVKQDVVVIAATNSPADHVLQLLFLLDALCAQGARVSLFFTYCGYARQDHPDARVVRAARVMSLCLEQFKLFRVLVLHPHSEFLQKNFGFIPVIPYDHYATFICEHVFDIIVAPDDGALPVCTHLARMVGKPVGVVHKKRTGQDQSYVLSLDAHVHGKSVLLVDDIVSTGWTIMHAAQALLKHGAQCVCAFVTHNLMTAQAQQSIESSVLEHVWVTNSLSVRCESKKITVLDVSSVITCALGGTASK